MNNGGWSGVMNSLIEIAKEGVPTSENDYIGDDGLLYCCNCHTRKQCKIMFNGKMMTPPVMCNCMKELEAQHEADRDLQKRQKAIASLKQQSLMDDRFVRSTFESFRENEDNQKALKVCKRYVERFDTMYEKNQGLLFYGVPGTGKSFMAACIANALIDKQVPTIMTSIVKLLSSQGFRESDEQIIAKLNMASLLIYDDLGVERGTDYAVERTYNYIDSRYRVKKPMIITTNLTLDEIKNATDTRYKRIYDRVLESCYPVEFTGKSWRLKEARDRYNDMKHLLEG